MCTGVFTCAQTEKRQPRKFLMKLECHCLDVEGEWRLTQNLTMSFVTLKCRDQNSSDNNDFGWGVGVGGGDHGNVIKYS